jgi:GT2 family glycosyltransferase
VIDACAQFDYPADRLHIQVLDDSTDITSQRVAERVAYWKQRGCSIAHVQRTHRTGYKAGALAHGLQRTSAPFVAVFDADFVPPAHFLKRLLPYFSTPDTGMVQARWAHLNPNAAWHTQGQAVGLDAHFTLEQAGRCAGGYFMHFNGTAGIWRRACIEEAGGWSADTLTEDLDLSYRAQLAGWQLRYIDDVAVPAELPRTISAWRTQQFRWTKGAIETARKLLGPLWRSSQRVGRKVAGSLHLLAHLAFPAITGAALLHAPLIVLADHSTVVPDAYLGALIGGVAGFGAFVAAVWSAQRARGAPLARTLRTMPAFLLGSMGLAVNNTRAVYAALTDVSIPFRRTPKGGAVSEGTSRTSWTGEMLLGLYSLTGVGVLLHQGMWSAVPFQSALALSFLLMAGTDQWERMRADLRPAPDPIPCKEAANPT